MRKRIIPLLLLRHGRLVKTVGFQSPVYIGDPVNAAKALSDEGADELLILDISAPGAPPPLHILSAITAQCRMPVSYGGGIRSMQAAAAVAALGIENIVLGSAAFEHADFLGTLSRTRGLQSVIAALDCKRTEFGWEVRTHGGSCVVGVDPRASAMEMQQRGAGEILLTSIDRDGAMNGYDHELIRLIADAVTIPVIAYGGAGCLSDMTAAMDAGADAAATGSLIVYDTRDRRQVLVTLSRAAVVAPILPAPSSPRRHAATLDVTRCVRCLYDDSIPSVTFDAHGVCNYCAMHDRLEGEHPTGVLGRERLVSIMKTIRAEGRGKKYDVVVGVSGGTDSSFMLHLCHEYGLRPLAVHYDNTWDNPIASRNIDAMLNALRIPLETTVVDNVVANDLYRSFLEAGVIDVDAPTDIGLAATLYLAAERHGVRTILEGHSFRTEGIAPTGWVYMDGKYVESVVRTHGRYDEHRLQTFPSMSLTAFLRWTVLKRIRKVRPLYYLDYYKDRARELLSKKYGWTWYDGDHLENHYTAFVHTCILPERFGVDLRIVNLSGRVRSGQIQREEALSILQASPVCPPALRTLVTSRLGLTDADGERILKAPKKSWRDFATYRPVFRRLRPLFRLLAASDLVPKTFYLKYTAKE